MHFRVKELAWLGPLIEWLTPEDALREYERVDRFVSREHYGFNPSIVTGIERVSADVDLTMWLQQRVPCSGRVVVVFGRDAVCKMAASVFVEQWQNIFCPARDDAITSDDRHQWALFYCHEDEFEFAYNVRIRVNP